VWVVVQLLVTRGNEDNETWSKFRRSFLTNTFFRQVLAVETIIKGKQRRTESYGRYCEAEFYLEFEY